MALAFTGGGRQLEVADANAVGIWNLANQARITGRPFANPAPGNAVAFSPDGRTVATGGADGNVRLWDAATEQEIGAPMTADAQPVYAVAFGAGGSTLATAGGDGAARFWDVALPANLLRAACGIADGSLTRQQWADYAGTEPFQQVCPAG